MKDKKNTGKEYSTCLEELPFAEELQKTKIQPADGPFDGRVKDGRTGSPAVKKTAGNAMIESIMNLHRCAECPIRLKAIQKPHSLFSRIHSGHMTWWPGWKIYQAELRGRGAVEATGKNKMGEKP